MVFGSLYKNVTLLALCDGLARTGGALTISTASLVGFALAEDKFLATMAATIPAALLMRRVGRRLGFMAGTLIGAGGAVLAAWAIYQGSFALYCVATALLGAFLGFATYYRFAAAEISTEAFRTKAISLVVAGGLLAAFAGPNLAKWSRELIDGVEFAGAYITMIGLFALAILLLAFVTIPRPAADESKETGRKLSVIMAQPGFIVAVTAGVIGYCVMNLLMTVTPLAMSVYAHHFDDAAFVIQWHIVAMFAPSFFTGHLISRFGLVTIMLTGAALQAICIVIALSGDSVTHFWLALMFVGVGWNFLFIGGTTLLTRVYSPSERIKVQAANDFIIYSFIVVSSILSGVIHHIYGWDTLSYAAIPLLAIVIAALAWFRLRHRAAVAAPGA